MNVTLREYAGETTGMCALIRAFWLAHNGYVQTEEEAAQDLAAWTQAGHKLYFICAEGEDAGFVHLGSRGAEPDWLEDIFVLPAFQGKGIGTAAIRLTERIVMQYSDCLYIEAAARNERAIRLYRKIGYDCLNTITIRKDFHPEKEHTVSKQALFGMDFAVRTRNP